MILIKAKVRAVNDYLAFLCYLINRPQQVHYAAVI